MKVEFIRTHDANWDVFDWRGNLIDTWYAPVAADSASTTLKYAKAYCASNDWTLSNGRHVYAEARKFNLGRT